MQAFARLRGAANLYSLRFAPLVRPGQNRADQVANGFVEAIHGDSAGWTTVRFDCWDHGCPLFDAFVQAFRTRRWLVQTHFHFANWYEDVLDASLETYLARRPAILINTLRRRQKHLERAGKYHYRVLTGNPDLEMGIQDYQSVYAASWKSPEPYPDFVPGLISAAAGTGCLRLGFLVVNARPVAAQIWLLSGGRATLFKMAHDRRFDRCSPGSLLTLHMLGRAIEAEGVTEVDFGRGDEAYKSLWLSKRRERWGMLAFNPRTLPGALGAAGHFARRVAGRCLRRVVKAST